MLVLAASDFASIAATKAADRIADGFFSDIWRALRSMGKEQLVVHNLRHFKIVVTITTTTTRGSTLLARVSRRLPSENSNRSKQFLHLACQTLVLPNVKIDALMPGRVVLSHTRVVKREHQLAEWESAIGSVLFGMGRLIAEYDECGAQTYQLRSLGFKRLMRKRTPCDFPPKKLCAARTGPELDYMSRAKEGRFCSNALGGLCDYLKATLVNAAASSKSLSPLLDKQASPQTQPSLHESNRGISALMANSPR
ncbi:hypothetical protein KC344_g222 [Hortaea werneckii]|nr:hypothetical protein KC344_g222 [Hortaea werneckii]